MFANFMVMRVTTAANEARIMSGLHTMYGIGSLMVAGLVGWLFEQGLNWHAASLLTWIPTAVCLIHVVGEARLGGDVAHPRTKFGGLMRYF